MAGLKGRAVVPSCSTYHDGIAPVKKAVERNDSEEEGSTDSASEPYDIRSPLLTWPQTLRVVIAARLSPGCPTVLVMNIWPVVGQLGADSPHQLPLLNHGRGTALSIK